MTVMLSPRAGRVKRRTPRAASSSKRCEPRDRALVTVPDVADPKSRLDSQQGRRSAPARLQHAAVDARARR